MNANRSVVERLRRYEWAFPEGGLAICLGWAGIMLFSDPPNFVTVFYALMERVEDDETWWAWLATVGALLILAGLVAALLRRRRISLVCRWLGLPLAIFFFGVLGISYAAAVVNSIACLPILLLAAVAIWTLLRIPYVPGDP